MPSPSAGRSLVSCHGSQCSTLNRTRSAFSCSARKTPSRRTSLSVMTANPTATRTRTPASALAGYPSEVGRALCSYSGVLEPIGAKDTLRLTHSGDLFARRDSHDWQRECFAAERVQPFKQVFRKLYLRTPTETDTSGMTRRYARHQVIPGQALALPKRAGGCFHRRKVADGSITTPASSPISDSRNTFTRRRNLTA